MTILFTLAITLIVLSMFGFSWAKSCNGKGAEAAAAALIVGSYSVVAMIIGLLFFMACIGLYFGR